MRSKLGWIAIGAALIGLIIAYIVRGGEPEPAASVPTAITTSSSAPSKPAGTPTTSPTPRTATVPMPTVNPQDYTAQIDQATKITEAYFLLKPEDTPDTRRARVTALVPAGVMSTPDFGVGNIACTDQNRLTQQLTERAVVSKAEITIQVIKAESDGIYMLVPGVVGQYLPNGTPFGGTADCPATYSFEATFMWEKSAGRWLLVNFGNPLVT